MTVPKMSVSRETALPAPRHHPACARQHVVSQFTRAPPSACCRGQTGPETRHMASPLARSPDVLPVAVVPSKPPQTSPQDFMSLDCGTHGCETLAVDNTEELCSLRRAQQGLCDQVGI